MFCEIVYAKILMGYPENNDVFLTGVYDFFKIGFQVFFLNENADWECVRRNTHFFLDAIQGPLQDRISI